MKMYGLRRSAILPRPERRGLPRGLDQLTPADEKHGNAHAHVNAVVSAVIRDEYVVSVDRLTRTGKRTDFAPDITICPKALTDDGHSKIAEVAIEIADSQSRSDARWKAEQLINRGCRRVFLLDVTTSVLCEYSRETDDWRELARDELIEDATFVTSVTAAQMLEQIRHDSLVIEAYRLVGAPALIERENIARGEGKAEGALIEAKRVLQRLLTKRFGVSDDHRVAACTSVEVLETWAERLLTATNVEDVFSG